MTGPTSIEWATHSWNPTTGCNKVSQGCGNCYAEPISLEQQKKGSKKYRNGFKFTMHPDTINWPLTVKTPGRIFVNSMSDAGHEEMEQTFFNAMMDTMVLAADMIGHIFLVLTKRPGNLKLLLEKWGKPIHRNIWIGVSIENSNSDVLERIDILGTIPCEIRFLSVEPLLAPILPFVLEHYIDRNLVEWIIVGAESGEKRRPFNPNWAKAIRDLCQRVQIPFFYKQGSHRYSGQERLLDGREWNELPAEASIMKGGQMTL